MKEIIKNLLYKVLNKVWFIPTALILLGNTSFASSSIGTAEVNQATENIKNAVMKLAMPIRWNISICKYCYNSTKNDSKFKQCKQKK